MTSTDKIINFFFIPLSYFEMSDDFIYGLYLTMLEDENALRYCGEWVKEMCKELLVEYYK